MKIYSVKHESSVFLFRTGRSGAIVSNISFLFICILLDVDIGLRRWWIECVQKTNSPKLFHWKQMSVGWMESIEQGKHKRQNGRLRAPTHVSHYSHVFSDSINSIPPASHQPMKGTNDNVPHSFSAPAVAQRGPPFIPGGCRFRPAEGVGRFVSRPQHWRILVRNLWSDRSP